MRFLRHILLVLGTAALSTVIITAILNTTLLSADYWLKKADQAKVYDAASEAEANQAGRELGSGVNLTIPALQWRQELQRYLPELEDYIRHGGSAPTAPFADPAAKSTKSVTPTAANSPVSYWFSKLLQWQLPLAAASLVCAVAVTLLAHHRKHLLALAGFTGWTAVGLASWWLILKALPGLVAGHLVVGPEVAPYVPVMRLWVEAVTKGTNQLILEAMIALGIVTGILVILQFVVNHRPHGHEVAAVSTTNLPIFRRPE